MPPTHRSAPVRPLVVLRFLVCALLAVVAVGAIARADDDAKPFVPSAARGYRHMLDRGFVPATLDQEVFDNLWQAWPDADKDAAEKADAAERRRLIFARYGFTPRPDEPQGPPLQLAKAKGGYHLNCFTCHGGQVAGRVLPGLPNAHIALQDFVEDVGRVRRILKRPLGPSDIAARMVPHGNTIGTTNAVVFSIVLLQFRDPDLNVVPPKRRLRLPHHDLDAPPWWHYKRRTHLYIDGFTPVGHRSLMQFLLVPQNKREKVLAFEDEFRDIEAWIQTVEAPAYPYEVDAQLASQGETVFRASCAGCHGTYGKDGRYPNRLVPIEKLGTDRARLDAIRTEDRVQYARSWFTDYDPQGVRTDPGGYVAPPLDGIWASAPYFHNGAVPTLRHVLFPEERPRLWRRHATGYDAERVGLRIETTESLPKDLAPRARRQWFDTTQHGKSAAGHTFPAKLTKLQRRALLEYLKTL